MAVQQSPSLSSTATDPLRVFKFEVLFHPPQALAASLGVSASSSFSYGFMTVSGPAVNIEVIPYREGGMNTTALPVRTPVLTVNGWKPLEELEIGERVVVPGGEDAKVVDLYSATVKKTFTVSLADGTKADACFGHLWTVEVIRAPGKMETVTVPTTELKALAEKPGLKVYVPAMQPFEYEAMQDLPLDPYLLGILLAEGSLEDEGVSFAQDIRNTEVIERCRVALPAGCSLKTYNVKGNAWKHRITVGNDGPGVRNVNGRNPVLAALRDLGLLGKHAWEKFIPEIYLRASIEDRLELLRGIMDGDGSIDVKHQNSVNVRIASSSAQLLEGVYELVVSLGGRCRVARKTGRSYAYKGERVPSRDEYWISGMPELAFNPFFMPSKADMWKPAKRTMRMLRRIISVEDAGDQLVRCLEVSTDAHLFIHRGSPGIALSHQTQKMPGQADFGAITMSHGVKMAASQMDILWMSQLFTVMQGSGNQAPGAEFRMICDVYVLDHPVTTVSAPVKAAFRLYNTWPSSLAFSDFDAGANAFLIAQMSLAYEGFDVLVAAGSGTNEVSFSQ